MSSWHPPLQLEAPHKRLRNGGHNSIHYPTNCSNCSVGSDGCGGGESVSQLVRAPSGFPFFPCRPRRFRDAWGESGLHLSYADFIAPPTANPWSNRRHPDVPSRHRSAVTATPQPERMVRHQLANPSNLYNNFNHIRVRGIILNGAPNCRHSEQNCEPMTARMPSMSVGFGHGQGINLNAAVQRKRLEI
jgi:hypothetical protein